jgi:hypothetical protein
MRNGCFFKIKSGKIIFATWTLKNEKGWMIRRTGVWYSLLQKNVRFSHYQKFKRKFSRKKIKNFITINFKMSSFRNFHFLNSNSKIEWELVISTKLFLDRAFNEVFTSRRRWTKFFLHWKKDNMIVWPVLKNLKPYWCRKLFWFCKILRMHKHIWRLKSTPRSLCVVESWMKKFHCSHLWYVKYFDFDFFPGATCSRISLIL